MVGRDSVEPWNLGHEPGRDEPLARPRRVQRRHQGRSSRASLLSRFLESRLSLSARFGTMNLKVRWGVRASRLPGSASRRTRVEVDQFNSGRRDADRCSRDGRAPPSNNHDSWRVSRTARAFAYGRPRETTRRRT